MKHLKKNDLKIIGVVQSASYLLQLTNHKNVPKNHIQKLAFKKEVNRMILFLKKEVKKLKRL